MFGTINIPISGLTEAWGCILSLYLFNINVEYIMPSAELDEAQAGIKSARRNINNLRYADDTTRMQKVKKN